jgi:hypothetical protein
MLDLRRDAAADRRSNSDDKLVYGGDVYGVASNSSNESSVNWNTARIRHEGRLGHYGGGAEQQLSSTPNRARSADVVFDPVSA